MNENEVRQTIKNLILNNETTILDSITQQGQQRTFAHITTSSITPPTGYYYVNITTDSPVLSYRDEGINVLISSKIITYPVSVVLVDHVQPTFGEDELYETTDSDFQVVGDRMVNLLADIIDTNGKLTSPNNLVYTLGDTITKSNLATSWTDAESYHAVLSSEIRFELEECILS